MRGGGARERKGAKHKIKKHKEQKEKNVCEGHHQRSSHHSNGLIRFNVHLNHLKWNESLMKTVEPDVVA